MAQISARAPDTRRRTRKVSQGGDPASVPPLTVYGDLVDDVEVLPISSLNLVMTIGRTEDEREVVVPYLEFRIRSEKSEAEPNEEAGLALDKLITFENGAFLIMDMASDLARVSKQLASLARGPVGVEPDRTRYVLDCLRKAAAHIDAAAEEIGGALAAAPPAQKPAQPRRKSAR